MFYFLYYFVIIFSVHKLGFSEGFTHYLKNRSRGESHNSILKCGSLYTPIKEYLNSRLPVNYLYQNLFDIKLEISHKLLKNIIKHSTYDILSYKGLDDFSCAITGVKSLSDLAVVVGETEATVRYQYQRLIQPVKNEGGTDALAMYATAVTSIYTWLQNSGFPNMPLKKERYWEIETFVQDLQTSFGVEYLSEKFHDFPFPLAYPPFYVAQLLTESESVEQYADALGIDVKDLRSFGTVLNYEGVSAILGDIWATVHLLEALDNRGLLNLH